MASNRNPNFWFWHPAIGAQSASIHETYLPPYLVWHQSDTSQPLEEFDGAPNDFAGTVV
jgi:hypothetical protein